MFLKKAILNPNIKQVTLLNTLNNLTKLSSKPFVEFKKFDIPPNQQRHYISRSVLSFEMDKQILSSISNVNSQIHEKRAHLRELYENNKHFKNEFVFNIIHIHEANLEQLLNYYLYNHENFSNEELDYFLYVFCARSELTNKINIKMKDLEQHKAISLIWDYFLKNYKKIDNIDDCNKFLFLFYVYYNKYSFNRDDFMGKFFNKNNNRFFLNTVEKYLKLSLAQIPIGKLLNIITILGEFKNINYYGFLKNREDELEKLPYWTLRRLLVRVNSDIKNEKNLRQLINLLMNPLTKDFTSIDINEKSYLLKHLCLMDQRIILLSSSKKLKHQLYEEVISFLEELPEDADLNLHNLKVFVNLSQSAKYYETLLDDGKILKCLNKFLKAFDIFKKNEKMKAVLEEKETNARKAMELNQNNKNNYLELNKQEDANENKLNNKNESEFSQQDFLNKLNNMNLFNNENINKATGNENKNENLNLKGKEDVKSRNDDLFFEEIEELNDLDLKLRVIKKKEDEELEFLDSEALVNPIPTEAGKLDFDIFNKNSELEKFFFNEEEKENFKSEKTSPNNFYSNSSLNDNNNSQSSEKTEKDLFSSQISTADQLMSSTSSSSYSSSNNYFTNQQPLQNEQKIVFDKNGLSLEMSSIIGYYYLLAFHHVIMYKHHSFSENKELALKILKKLKRILFEMDIKVLKEKIKVNLIFDAFMLMEKHGLADKEFFNFLLDNFSENMVDIIVMQSFISFIHWTEKNLTAEEKKAFHNKITKIMLVKLTKDYTIYNFFRVTSLICSLNRKRTNLTDNLHFELISFIDLESKLAILIKLFSDYQKSLFQEVHKDYSRNLVSFLLNKIKIKELNLISSQLALMDFYFSMLAIDLEIFDPLLDKKVLEHYQNIIKYIESSPLFEVELYNVVKFFHKASDNYRQTNSERALSLFFEKIENILTNKRILLLIKIDRYMIYFALNSIQKKRSKKLIRRAVYLCDLVYEKTKTHLDFNFTESVTALEKLLEENIICKSIVKNFLVNIQIFKRLKESENFKLDDQTTFDINLINFKYQNVERNKDVINELLKKLKESEIISKELYNISLFK